MTLEKNTLKRELVKAHVMMRRAKRTSLRVYWTGHAHRLKRELAALKKDAGVSLH